MEEIVSIRPSVAGVDLLDQRDLPHAKRYLHCTSAMDVIEAIQSLAVRGAPAIAIAGLYGLWVEAIRLQKHNDGKGLWRDAAQRILRARPTAVNLAASVEDAIAQTNGIPWSQMPQYLRRHADAYMAQEQMRNERMADFGADLFRQPVKVLTHCNTGSLATVGIGTALGLIRRMHQRDLLEHVWVDETRPLLQGARLTAWELQHDGIPAQLVTDSMAGSLMGRGLVDAVIVGADRIAVNGDTANKIGTYGLAVLAHHHGVPFYVVAPTTTIDAKTHEGSGIPIEERGQDEVRTIGNQPVAPIDFPVYNPAFDVTPNQLITGIVTETGVLSAPFEQTIGTILSGAHRT